MKRFNKVAAEYARIVALYGPDSAAAESFRRAQDGDDDFARFARLTDSLLAEYDRMGIGLGCEEHTSPAWGGETR